MSEIPRGPYDWLPPPAGRPEVDLNEYEAGSIYDDSDGALWNDRHRHLDVPMGRIESQLLFRCLYRIGCLLSQDLYLLADVFPNSLAPILSGNKFPTPQRIPHYRVPCVRA